MIVVDVETSGIDPNKHSLLSIGAFDFFEPAINFYGECRLRDGAEFQPQALEVNGFSLDQINDPSKPTCLELMKEFLAWTEKCSDVTIAGQNPSFDKDFIVTEIIRGGLNQPFGYRTVDLHAICVYHHLIRGMSPPIKDRRTNLNLDGVLNYVGLDAEPKPHNGLVGAKMELEALNRLIYAEGKLEEFKGFPIPEYLFI